MAPTVSTRLEQIASPALLARGVVNTIELDAVRKKLGDKWERRKEQVWGQVEKVIHADLGDAPYFVRVTETSFLICLPDLKRDAAQAQCARVLKDVLIFFLGASAHADIIVRNVTHIDAQHMTTAPVKLSDDLTPEARHAASPAQAAPAFCLPSERIVPSAAGPLSISFNLEHVFRIADSSLSAIRIKVNVFESARARMATPQRMQALETAAIVLIDAETVALARQLLSADEFARLAVIVPVHIQTVASSRGRVNVLRQLDDHSLVVRRRVFAELVNLTTGTPASVLAEAVSLLRPRVRGVFARLFVTDKSAGDLTALKLAGIVMDTGGCEPFELTLAKEILTHSEAARRVAPTLLAGPLPNAGFVDVCDVAGVTHYALSPTLKPATQPIPQNPSDPADALLQLIYVSRSKTSGKDACAILDSIVRQGCERNRRDFITSMLVLQQGWFVQVLEGRRDAVSAKFKRVLSDPRHDGVELVRAHPIAEREFPKWSLTGVALSADDQGDVLAAPSLLTPDQASNLLRRGARQKEREEKDVA